jgi:hypothetical protein
MTALLGISTTTAVVVLVVVIAVVLVLVLVAWWVERSRRSHQLRESFGPEYDVAVDQSRNRGTAERDLSNRLARHETLPLRPLDAASQQRYLDAWESVQTGFVDRPQHAVVEADELIRSAMVERGYPAQSFEQQVSDLSVEHASVLDGYRSAHAIADRAPDEQSTEDLRRAMVGYRQLFVDVVGVSPGTHGVS